MKQYSVKIDGKNVLYKGSLSCSVVTRFTFWQRIKILFGGKCVSTIQIFTKEYSTPVGQQIVTGVTNKKVKL